MATFQVNPPEQFSFNKPDEWSKWSRRFERFRQASGLGEKDGVIQINTLIYSMGSEADEILNSFVLTADQKKDYDYILKKFNDYFVVRRNTIFERAKFNQRKQGEGESVDSFITSLYTLSEYCEYGTLHDEMIRDRIVVGLRDEKLSERLQLDEKLTLERAVTQARQSEAVKKQQSVVRSDVEAVASKVDTLNFKSSKKLQQKSGFKGTSQGMPKGKSSSRQKGSNYKHPNPSGRKSDSQCGRCGQSPSHDRNSCPARDRYCLKCKVKGHFIKVCRNVKVGNVDEEPGISSDSNAFLGSVHCYNNQPWLVKLKLGNKLVEFKIDTGADVTVVPESLHSNSKSPQLSRSDKSLFGPGQKKLEVCGKFKSSLALGEKVTQQDVYVVKDLCTPLLGRPAIEALEIVSRAQLDLVEETSQSVQEKFPKLFKGLGKIEGNYQIKLVPGAVPFSLNTPRRVPLPLLPKVKDELKNMEAQGIIEKIDEATDWCAGMVVVPKPNGRIRICVDLTNLNKSVMREKHPLPIIDHTLAKLAGAKVFSKVDANSGFYQIELDKESALLTTFITPFGRYFYKRLPFGISSAPEHFQKRMSEILDGLDGVVCQTDDILVFGSNQTEHDSRLIKVLETLNRSGITLNDEKCEFSRNRVKFVGHIVDGNGISPDPDKIRAIQEISPPQDIGGVRRFMGMVNQMGKFSNNIAEKSKPLRELLSKKNQWVWGAKQDKAFSDIKQELCTSPTLAMFDPTKETVISSDASSFGLGAVITQIQSDGSRRAVAYASRSMSETECRYAQIEKEALAITWACDKFSDFLIGSTFLIETDHKPLIPLLGTKDLSELPPRIQRFRLKLMRFDYQICHVPGKELYTPDTLSRAPIESPSESEQQFAAEVYCYVNSVLDNLPATNNKLSNIAAEQDKDPICKDLKWYVLNGWPNDRSLVNETAKLYWQFRAELSIQNNLLMRGNRIVVPVLMRQDILERLHEGHQGIVKCRERASISVWWPGLSSQIESLVKNCQKCAQYQADQAEPLIPTRMPERPWQKVGTDLFSHRGNTYILVVDYFSRYIEIAKLNSTSSETTINVIKSIFGRHGIPDEVISDNGPQYASAEFTKFAAEYGFIHSTSSPRYPQSNGESERAVRTIKQLLNKSSDPYKAMLSYRSTPLANGYSPAELLFGRRIKTDIPINPDQLVPEWSYLPYVLTKEQTSKDKQKKTFDHRHRARTLTPLTEGNHVWIKDYKSPGIVVAQTESPRSFLVRTDNGLLRRNRRHLVPCPSLVIPQPDNEMSPASNEEARPTEAESAPCDSGSRSSVVTRSGRVSKPPNRMDL